MLEGSRNWRIQGTWGFKVLEGSRCLRVQGTWGFKVLKGSRYRFVDGTCGSKYKLDSWLRLGLRHIGAQGTRLVHFLVPFVQPKFLSVGTGGVHRGLVHGLVHGPVHGPVQKACAWAAGHA